MHLTLVVITALSSTLVFVLLLVRAISRGERRWAGWFIVFFLLWFAVSQVLDYWLRSTQQMQIMIWIQGILLILLFVAIIAWFKQPPGTCKNLFSTKIQDNHTKP
jgi:hypothetical protein